MVEGIESWYEINVDPLGNKKRSEILGQLNLWRIRDTEGVLITQLSTAGSVYKFGVEEGSDMIEQSFREQGADINIEGVEEDVRDVPEYKIEF